MKAQIDFQVGGITQYHTRKHKTPPQCPVFGSYQENKKPQGGPMVFLLILLLKKSNNDIYLLLAGGSTARATSFDGRATPLLILGHSFLSHFGWEVLLEP